MNWRWLDRRVLLLLHEENLAEHGGTAGLRDEALLDAILARPVRMAREAGAGAPDLAAAYAASLIKECPFTDGNERCALLAAGWFLALNGYRLTASPLDAVLAVGGLARAELDEAAFAEWIRRHCKPA